MVKNKLQQEILSFFSPDAHGKKIILFWELRFQMAEMAQTILKIAAYFVWFLRRR